MFHESVKISDTHVIILGWEHTKKNNLKTEKTLSGNGPNGKPPSCDKNHSAETTVKVLCNRTCMQAGTIDEFGCPI